MTRVWIAVLGAAAAAVAGLCIAITWRWATENTFDQFDPGYWTLGERLWRPLLVLAAIPIVGFIVWAVARWIARGFSN